MLRNKECKGSPATHQPFKVQLVGANNVRGAEARLCSQWWWPQRWVGGSQPPARSPVPTSLSLLKSLLLHPASFPPPEQGGNWGPAKGTAAWLCPRRPSSKLTGGAGTTRARGVWTPVKGRSRQTQHCKMHLLLLWRDFLQATAAAGLSPPALIWDCVQTCKTAHLSFRASRGS